MREAYSRVIDLIDSGEINHRAVAMALAKSRPEIFLAIHDAVSQAAEMPDKSVKLDLELLEFINRGLQVEAIKHHRTQTGMGLKESKDYCDALRDRGTPNPSRSGKVAPAPMDLNKLLNELLRSTDPTGTDPDRPRNHADYL